MSEPRLARREAAPGAALPTSWCTSLELAPLVWGSQVLAVLILALSCSVFSLVCSFKKTGLQTCFWFPVSELWYPHTINSYSDPAPCNQPGPASALPVASELHLLAPGLFPASASAPHSSPWSCPVACPLAACLLALLCSFLTLSLQQGLSKDVPRGCLFSSLRFIHVSAS